MRIDENDPNTFAKARFGCVVFLDGKLCTLVQIADDTEGFVEAPLIKDDGMPVFDTYDENYAIVRRTGKVEIIKNDSFPEYTPETLLKIFKESPFHYLTQPRGFV